MQKIGCFTQIGYINQSPITGKLPLNFQNQIHNITSSFASPSNKVVSKRESRNRIKEKCSFFSHGNTLLILLLKHCNYPPPKPEVLQGKGLSWFLSLHDPEKCLKYQVIDKCVLRH